MKVTITGASGFVGSNIQNYLNEAHQLYPVSLRYLDNQILNVQTDAVIHLAGKAHDLKKVSNPTDYSEANFELTKQLFDAFLISKATVFIFMSTVKAVADTVEGVLTEDVIANPTTHYGITKYKAEQYLLSKELPEGKRLYILRPCMVHGPGNKGNLNLLYQLVSKDIPWPLGAFKNERSFLSIENLCFVIKELLENEKIPLGIYNIADDMSLSTNQLIDILGLSLGRKVNIWTVNKTLVKSIAKIGSFLYLPINSERLQKLTENYVVSNKKIVKALGMSLPISSTNGLVRTFESFKKNK